jgi:hypothetical protein
MVRDRIGCRPDDRIVLVPDAARAHVFDAATGLRLVV